MATIGNIEQIMHVMKMLTFSRYGLRKYLLTMYKDSSKDIQIAAEKDIKVKVEKLVKIRTLLYYQYAMKVLIILFIVISILNFLKS